MEIPVIVERLRNSQEFLAYSGEAQCLTTGDTSAQAIMNFREDLHDLVTYHGDEITVDLFKNLFVECHLSNAKASTNLVSRFVSSNTGVYSRKRWARISASSRTQSKRRPF